VDLLRSQQDSPVDTRRAARWHASNAARHISGPSLLQQELFGKPGHAEQETGLGRFEHTLLHLSQFDIQDLL